MDKKRLDEIRARCEAATPGLWEEWPDLRTDIYTVRTTNDTGGYFEAGQLVRGMHHGLNEAGQIHIAEFAKYYEQMQNDAVFVARVRQDVPDLFDHITAQKAEIVEMHEAVKEAVKDRKYFEAEVKRLRKALSRLQSEYVVGQCDVCGIWLGNPGDDKQHHDGCPFAILEEGK